MQVITREEFLKLEGEVLYSKYVPCSFNGFEIKLGNTGENDWVCDTLDPGYIKSEGSEETLDILVALEKQATQVDKPLHAQMDFTAPCRDGLYEDPKSLIAVYDQDCVLALTNRLLRLLPGYKLIKDESQLES